MLLCYKIHYALLILLLLTVKSIPTAVPDSAKIRIHVPVKHHTHLHTKTVVKTVRVGIPVKPVKQLYDDIEDERWDYGKRKKIAANNYFKLFNY
ncbi:uncharacterized protein LOC129779279 [Toxorhynchites rutilus septentrionalis]|uniref:uncharacterized protein LOC129779279 n=1 Tax=Toxorhynchites rutilus septentrionalis TaxID=329112 RepID=UPI00247898D5|nr:uncharacterized protein LOC129779279 [Toxorhynchites rutilus septentrionalis]